MGFFSAVIVAVRVVERILHFIRTLADGQGRGALNLSHFLVAMFLVSRVKSGALPAVPASLPPHVISGITTGQQTSAASTPFDMPMSPSKMPASTPFTPQQPVVSAPAAAPILAAQSTETLNWAIGPKEKDAYDRVFEKSDVGGKGYLSCGCRLAPMRIKPTINFLFSQLRRHQTFSGSQTCLPTPWPAFGRSQTFLKRAATLVKNLRSRCTSFAKLAREFLYQRLSRPILSHRRCAIPLPQQFNRQRRRQRLISFRSRLCRLYPLPLPFRAHPAAYFPLLLLLLRFLEPLPCPDK